MLGCCTSTGITSNEVCRLSLSVIMSCNLYSVEFKVTLIYKIRIWLSMTAQTDYEMYKCGLELDGVVGC